jgi:precorrin-2/cobalt-factor-2 C20-methyltransferase
MSLDSHPDLLPTPSLTIIGVGPGDAELITVKGLHALQAADVIFAPIAAAGKSSIAQSIIQPWLRPDQRIVPILTPMVQDEEVLGAARLAAAQTIARELAPDRRGAYIILGDPMLYGTFTPIAAHLRTIAPEIEQRIVPGVTAISAAAAATETPLVSGAERLAILPGLRERSRTGLMRVLRQFGRVAIMKAGPAFPWLVEMLAELDLLEDAVYVERLGLEGERIVQGRDLTQLPSEKRTYLSLMLLRNPLKSSSRPSSLAAGVTYPVHLTHLAESRIVVVGGGAVGERKVRWLLAADARPILISPEATVQLQRWAVSGRLTWQARAYRPEDVQGVRLVFAATDDAGLNARIAQDAAAAGAWCNVADNARLGDFHVPAVHRTQGVVVSVGTEGQAPARASAIRDAIARWLK